jgi:integrase
MTIYAKPTKSGTRYYYQTMLKGKYFRGGGYKTKREARIAEAERRNLPVSPPAVMDFGSLCELYLDNVKIRQSKLWYNEKRGIIKKQFNQWFAKYVDQITPEEIETHLLQRAEDISPYMANKDFKILKSIFNFSIKKKYLTYNPCSDVEKLPEDERTQYIPPLKDFLKVYLVAPPVDKRLLLLLVMTAGRIGEVLSLEWTDIQDDVIILKSRKHKGGELRKRKVPIHPITQDVLDWLRVRSNGKYVFWNARSLNKFNRRPKLMRSLCKKAGVKPFGFHSIRRLSSSVLSKENIPLKDISSILGHSKIETTEIYIQSIDDSLTRAIDKLGDAIQQSFNKLLNTDENCRKILQKEGENLFLTRGGKSDKFLISNNKV